MCVTDIIVDLMLLCLPLVPLWQLSMKMSQKVGLSFLFALGVFSVAAGVTRMVLFLEILTYRFGSSDVLFGLRGTADSLGILSTAIWWSVRRSNAPETHDEKS